MTYPLIGSYGINPEDMESDQVQVSALPAREYQHFPSNHRSCGDLAGYLKGASVLGIEALDTRAVTCHIRKAGAIIVATRGTADYLETHGISITRMPKIFEGRPHVVDAVKNGEIQMVMNTGHGDRRRQDGYIIRRAAIKYHIPYATTIAGAIAMCVAIAALRTGPLPVRSLQEYIGRPSTTRLKAVH